MAENMYTNPDGSPKWIGGSGNSSYKPTLPGTRQASSNNQWTLAEKARLRAIEARKKGTLESLQRNEVAAQNQYNFGSASLGGQTQTGRRSLAEYMAQRGLTNSGISAQGEINAIGNLQQGLGGLESTRESALANIQLQRTAAETQALQSQAELAGSAEERQIAEKAAADARDLAAIQAGAYNQDVQAEINRRKAINPNDPMIPFLNAQRYSKLSSIAESEAEAEQQQFENELALRKLAASRSGSGGGGTSDGMTDAEYSEWAIGKATSGGKFNQDTYDTLMAFRNSGGTIDTSSSGVPTSFYDPDTNEDAQVQNFVMQFDGGRIGLGELKRQLNGLGYKYDERTSSVIPL